MTDNDNKTSETVIESAKAGTLPGALSAVAVTEAPAETGDIWSKPAAVAAANYSPPEDVPNRDDNTDKDDAAAEHETRIQRLEDEIAFLRKMFGWPEKA